MSFQQYLKENLNQYLTKDQIEYVEKLSNMDDVEFIEMIKKLSKEELENLLLMFEKEHESNKKFKIYNRKGIFAVLGKRYKLNMESKIRFIKSVLKLNRSN